MSLQHFVGINHSVCTGRAISCYNKLRDTSQRQIASCVLENFCENLCLRNKIKILSLQQVAKNQIRLNLCDLLRRQILLQRQRFSQISPVHTKRFVAATCRRDMLLQLAAWCVPTLNGWTVFVEILHTMSQCRFFIHYLGA